MSMSVTVYRSPSEIRAERRRVRGQADRARRRLDDLNAVLRALDVELHEAVDRTRANDYGGLDPHVQAGHNVGLMERVFAKRRTATMAEAAHEAGVASGTSTWCIRALLADGVIEPTGARVNRSMEYRYVPATRRETTLGPGE